LQVAELCRAIEVTRRKLPKIPELEEEIILLQSHLEEERVLTVKLSSELEVCYIPFYYRANPNI